MAEFYSEIFIRCCVVFFAMWIGGLSTTIYSRLPNGVKIGPTHKPTCDSCGGIIKPKHFFPIIGYILSRGKCVNCGVKIPKVYPILEVVIALYIILISFTYTIINEKFIFKSLFGAYCIVLLFVYFNYKKINSNMIFVFISLLLAYRGYNGNLPTIVNLFFCSAFSYITFRMYSINVEMERNDFILSTIIMMSLGDLICFISFIPSLIIWQICKKRTDITEKMNKRKELFLLLPIVFELIYIIFK